jgi:proteasome alpha subunit
VDARSLANAYAQLIGQVFTHDLKPLEVEILVAEVGPPDGSGADQLYHLLYDGTVVDEDRFSVIGGESEGILERMASAYTEGWSLADALKAGVAALAGPGETIDPGDLEVAVLERPSERRAFRRVEGEELVSLLG